MPDIRAIVSQAEKDDFAFYSIVQGIVSTDQFRYKQAPVLVEESADLAQN